MGPANYAHIFARLKKVVERRKGWEACCPVHDDRTASLSINLGERGQLLMRCHASDKCDWRQVAEVIGVPETDFFPDAHEVGTNGRRRDGEDQREFVCSYDYRDEADRLLYQVCRWRNPKTFSQRRPNPDRARDRSAPEWVYSMAGVRRVLYKLPQLLRRLDEEPRRWVLVLEGEKAVDRAWDCGLVATSAQGGANAGSWTHPSYWETLKGCNVVLCPDNDPYDDRLGYSPGAAHMERVGRTLVGWANRVVWLDLPGLPPKGDFWDWCEGKTRKESREKVKRLVRDSKDWQPKLTPADLAALSAVARHEAGSKLKPSSMDEVQGSIGSRLARMQSAADDAQRAGIARDMAAYVTSAVTHLEKTVEGTRP